MLPKPPDHLKRWMIAQRILGPKSEPPAKGRCWLWPGNRAAQKYPYINIAPYTKRKVCHVAAQLWLDVTPSPGTLILHKCDNRECWRPSHLYAGTYTDNNQDRTRRDRNNSRRGSHHQNSKLEESQVRDIKARWAAGEGVTRLGREFGVSHATISHIIRGKTWSHVCY